jgi:hypothetical protein
MHYGLNATRSTMKTKKAASTAAIHIYVLNSSHALTTQRKRQSVKSIKSRCYSSGTQGVSPLLLVGTTSDQANQSPATEAGFGGSPLWRGFR